MGNSPWRSAIDSLPGVFLSMQDPDMELQGQVPTSEKLALSALKHGLRLMLSTKVIACTKNEPFATIQPCWQNVHSTKFRMAYSKSAALLQLGT